MIYQKYLLKRVFITIFLFFISNNYLLTPNSRIKTCKESNRFLNEYCIDIINVIKDAYQTLVDSIENNDLKKIWRTRLLDSRIVRYLQ